jgi:flagellar biosynthesis protein FlhF
MNALLAAMIEQELRVAPPITPVRGQRKVIALVGPTGVGKTTTLAKLAANFRLREGAKIGLVTVDTYRIAAVEQLRTYAEIIDLPMRVVTTPVEMRQAMAELSGLDLVLVDTAGRSPKDEVQIRELKAFLDEARADEIHLVLSLASSIKTLEAAAANFQPIGLTSLVLTKLDEALGAGTLLNVARRLKTPVSYLTTGQDVPEDIEPAHKTRMARLILGLDQVESKLDRALRAVTRDRIVSAA